MTDVATLRLRLSEAEDALHKVSIGKAVTVIGEGGNSVTYSRVNRNELVAYISQLKRQIAALEGHPVRRGPVQFVF
jgi:hypothetical protein